MRLGTRLLLHYAAVLLMVGGALSVALPRITRQAVLRSTAHLLQAEVQRLARGPLSGARLAALLRGAADDTLAVRNLAVVDPQNRVVQGGGLFRRGEALPASLARLAGHVRQSGRPAGLPLPELDVVVAAAPVQVARQESGYVLFLFQPVREMAAAVRLVQVRVLLWTLVGLAVAVVLAGLVGRSLTVRLRRLQAAAAAVAAGDLSHRVPAEGSDEFADLARSFNHMAERLQETVEGLRRAEQLRRDLSATLAHELRTPITSIRGFAEALRDGVVRDPDQGRRYLDIIATEAARLGRLVQDLFDLATLEAGRMEFRFQPVHLLPWLREFAAGAAARVESAGLRFVARLPEPDGRTQWVAAVDRDRIAQVLHNLLENALRYAPPGSEIGLEAAAAGDGTVRITVSDQGPGIPPEEQDRIWDRFYRGGAEPHRGVGGAGLGLAIVRSIVTAHGGQVGVESAHGAGARFWFTLPLERR